MRTKAFAFFLLVSATVSLERKCEPKMWEADFFGKNGQYGPAKVGKEALVFNIRGTHFKDVDRKMEVLIKTIQRDKYVVNLTLIRDGNSGMAYVVDYDANRCEKGTDPAGPARHLCTDTPRLTPTGSLNVGTYTLDLYNYEAPNGNSTLTFDRNSFTLFNGVTIQTSQPYDQMITMQYGNMSTTDIPSSVFTIPSICNKK